MKKFILILPLLVLILFFKNAEAQKSWDEIEYPPLNSFEKPDVEIFELDNGITFYLVEDDELPLINLRVLLRTGGVLVPNEKTGLQSIAGTVMRTGGTTSISGDELNELLEDRAARMETSIGLTSGSASMNVLKDDFDELLPVFIDLLQNPVFPENRINLAKTQQKSGISRRNDETIPIGIREFQKLIYGDESVYARNTEIATIDEITREDLVEFHLNSFVGNNMMIGVIGDFEMDEMKDLLSEAFQAIPAGEETELNFPEVSYDYVDTINLVDKSDVNQSFVMMGHIGGLRENPDYAKIQVMNRILSDGFSGRLMRIIRGQMGLAYSVFGQYGSGNFYPGIFYAGVMTQSETTAEAINAILDQINRLQDETVSEQELNDVIDRFLNSLVFEYDSRVSVLNERMSYDYAGLDPDTFDRLVEEIQAVTVEDVQEVAQKYLRPDALQILVVGNKAEIGDQLDQFGEINEVDISIPLPGDDEEDESVVGDSEAGRAWMDQMVKALMPEDTISGDLIFEGENVVQTQMGEITIGLKQTINFDDDKLIAEVEAPMGQITMQVVDGQGAMMMGENEMPMQPAQRDEMLNEYYRNPLYLAINGEELDVQYMGSVEMDGMNLEHLTVHGNQTLQLYLDPETALPAVITYRQFNPETGQMATLRQVSENWTESNGVLLPYKTTTYSGEEVVSIVEIESHSIE